MVSATYQQKYIRPFITGERRGCFFQVKLHYEALMIIFSLSQGTSSTAARHPTNVKSPRGGGSPARLVDL